MNMMNSGAGGAWKNPPSIQSCTSRFIPGCTAGDLLESCLEHVVSSVEKSDVFPPATVENARKSTRKISLKVDDLSLEVYFALCGCGFPSR